MSVMFYIYVVPGYHTEQVLSLIAKGRIVARVQPLRCLLFLLPNYIHICAIVMHHFSYLDKRKVVQQEYSQPPMLPSPYFRWVVN